MHTLLFTQLHHFSLHKCPRWLKTRIQYTRSLVCKDGSLSSCCFLQKLFCMTLDFVLPAQATPFYVTSACTHITDMRWLSMTLNHLFLSLLRARVGFTRPSTGTPTAAYVETVRDELKPHTSTKSRLQMPATTTNYTTPCSCNGRRLKR